jgi:hypothetical protein
VIDSIESRQRSDRHLAIIGEWQRAPLNRDARCPIQDNRWNAHRPGGKGMSRRERDVRDLYGGIDPKPKK